MRKPWAESARSEITSPRRGRTVPNVLVPGGAADTRLVPRAMAPDRSQLIPPEVMVAPLIWLCSADSDGINGLRFIAMRWDDSLPPAEAAKKAGAPSAWQQLGRQAIMPERMR